MSQFKSKYDVVYEFKISRVAEGNFKNLWKLEVKSPADESLKELVDADSLSTCIDKLQLVFEVDGF